MHVTIDGVRLFFDVLNPQLDISGSHTREKPALVCIPGGPGGDHQTLRPYFDRFADVAQVIYLDPRGGGRSDYGPEAAWTLDRWGDDIAAFCDALELEKPFVIGSSGGTLMVQSFLVRHPARAAGAVLLNACSRMDQDALVSGYEELGGPEAGRAARAMYGRPTQEDYVAFYRHCLPLYSRKRDLTALADGARRSVMNQAASTRFFAPDGEAFRFDFRDRLGKVEARVLVVAGAHDPVTPAKWGIEVFEALPAGRAELLVLEESGHLVTADQPEQFDGAVRRFIERR
jgi:pimeloyl-ACP methyl ester carboxylesterase